MKAKWCFFSKVHCFMYTFCRAKLILSNKFHFTIFAAASAPVRCLHLNDAAKRRIVMKTLGNILWFVLVGLWTGITWAVLGVLWCITIIGIPFGKQCFKMAGITFLPFGKRVDLDFGKHPVLNVLWMVFTGLETCIVYGLIGIILCITIIGIPFGKQCFKMAKLVLMPFGAEVS